MEQSASQQTLTTSRYGGFVSVNIRVLFSDGNCGLWDGQMTGLVLKVLFINGGKEDALDLKRVEQTNHFQPVWNL